MPYQRQLITFPLNITSLSTQRSKPSKLLFRLIKYCLFIIKLILAKPIEVINEERSWDERYESAVLRWHTTPRVKYRQISWKDNLIITPWYAGNDFCMESVDFKISERPLLHFRSFLRSVCSVFLCNILYHTIEVYAVEQIQFFSHLRCANCLIQLHGFSS